jgi:hypothetical protein
MGRKAPQQVGNNYEDGGIKHVAVTVVSNETTPNKKHSWSMDFTNFTTLTCCDRRRHEVGLFSMNENDGVGSIAPHHVQVG